MTTSATTPKKTPRRGPGWLPNQHGAWAMIASPLMVGVIAGGPTWVHLPLAAFWFVSYFAFFAISLWLKANRRAKWFPPVRTYTIAAAVLGLVTALAAPGLLRWAPLFVVPVGVGFWAAAQRRERELLTGLATVAGACLMTLVAYDAAGPVSGRAWWLALVQFLYFAGTVFYVKSIIRERGNRRFLILSVGYHLVAAALAWWLAWQLGVVFAVLAVRAAVIPGLGWSPKKVGIWEIPATILVAGISLTVL